ncbi:hypothetical protein Sjap_001074 [Stephania japonica]|uniref:Uncharacterized protein n=1 Tax=Stephania japonica TaxID=461633 RepID=A0AAP0PT56_9MAGN
MLPSYLLYNLCIPSNSDFKASKQKRSLCNSPINLIKVSKCTNIDFQNRIPKLKHNPSAIELKNLKPNKLPSKPLSDK